MAGGFLQSACCDLDQSYEIAEGTKGVAHAEEKCNCRTADLGRGHVHMSGSIRPLRDQSVLGAVAFEATEAALDTHIRNAVEDRSLRTPGSRLQRGTYSKAKSPRSSDRGR